MEVRLLLPLDEVRKPINGHSEVYWLGSDVNGAIRVRYEHYKSLSKLIISSNWACGVSGAAVSLTVLVKVSSMRFPLSWISGSEWTLGAGARSLQLPSPIRPIPS